MLSDPGYRFCPKCGSTLSKRRLKEFEPERLVCTQCFFVMYLNPKVAAGTVIEYEGGIVLLRREIDPRRGFWVHPGGFVDRGETVEAAARRETREEVGLDVEITRLLGAFSFHDSEVVVVTFAARVISGTPVVGDESLEVATFAPNEIPWADLAFPSTELALREYLRTMDAPAAAHVVSRKSADSPLAHDAKASEDGRLETLLQARSDVREARDVRAASLVYPALIGALREARRYREALSIAEEGLALTHDPLIARLADETAHELADSEAERC
jgi:ADP-ribose pyrophosphatase YjhB (NUDIX family)